MLVWWVAARIRFSALVESATRNSARSPSGTGHRRRITSVASCSMSHGRSVGLANSEEVTKTTLCALSDPRRTRRSHVQRRPIQSSTRITSQVSPMVARSFLPRTPSGSRTTVVPDVRVRTSGICDASQVFTHLPGSGAGVGRRAGSSRSRGRDGQQPGRRDRYPEW